LKILMISNCFPSRLKPRHGVFVLRLSKELNKSGNNIIVLAPKIFAGEPFLERIDGIKVYRFMYPSGNKTLGQSPGIPVFTMLIYMISGILSALRIVSKERPDIIHGHWIVPTGLIASITGLITGIPVVNTARGMDVRISNTLPIIDWLFKLAVKLSRVSVVVSPAMRHKNELKDAEIIPSGVDEMFFNIKPRRTKDLIIYTRSLEPIYDVETLIKSIPVIRDKAPGARFIIAGSGSQLGYLKDLAKKLGIRDSIDFLGEVENREIARLAQEASIFVSTARADGTSIALLEAMAAGLIPVVTDIDANRAWLEHDKDGFLFRPGDEYDLARNIVKALEKDLDMDILENKAREIKSIASWQTISERYIDIYKSIATNKKDKK